MKRGRVCFIHETASSDSDSDTGGGSKLSTDYSGIYDEVLSDDAEVRLLSLTSLM